MMNPIQPTQVYNNFIPLSNYTTYYLNSLNPYNYKDFQEKRFICLLHELSPNICWP